MGTGFDMRQYFGGTVKAVQFRAVGESVNVWLGQGAEYRVENGTAGGRVGVVKLNQ